VGILLNVKAPFTVLQLLWINVIMDTLASIALCSERRAGVMKLPPKKARREYPDAGDGQDDPHHGKLFHRCDAVAAHGYEARFLARQWPWSVETAGAPLAVPQNDRACARSKATVGNSRIKTGRFRA